MNDLELALLKKEISHLEFYDIIEFLEFNNIYDTLTLAELTFLVDHKAFMDESNKLSYTLYLIHVGSFSSARKYVSSHPDIGQTTLENLKKEFSK